CAGRGAHVGHSTRRPPHAEGTADPGHAAEDPRGAGRSLAGVPRRYGAAGGTRLAHGDPGDRQEDRLGPAALLLRPATDAGRSPCRAGREADRAAAAEGPARSCPRALPGDAGRDTRAQLRDPRPADPSRPGDLPRPPPQARALPDPRPLPLRGPEGALISGPTSRP